MGRIMCSKMQCNPCQPGTFQRCAVVILRQLFHRARFRCRCHNRIIMKDYEKEPMVWTDSGMLYDTTNGRWKLTDRSGHMKKATWSNHFTLNLVKLTLQFGNQPGSSFVTMSQLSKFHSYKYSFKIPYPKKHTIHKTSSHIPITCKQNH